jgi:hypothetical protein
MPTIRPLSATVSVCGFLLASSLWGGQRLDSIKSDYAAVIAQLDPTCDWQFCHDKRLRKAWALAGDWLAATLEEHPAATAADLDASLAEIDPHKGEESALSHQVLDLGQGDFLVAVSYGETGTFFVVGKEPKATARVKWSIDSYTQFLAKHSILHCWNVEADCGPFFASLAPLPPTARGHPRFYVDAGKAGNGMTIGAQLTVWSWTGSAARLLGSILYSEMIDDDRKIQFDGRDLILPIKEDAESFISSGASPDPQGTWKLRITPRGVQDLGHRWSQPELQWFDRLSDTVQKGRDTRELAAPAVARRLKPLREDLHEMLMSWSVKRGKTTQLSVTLEDLTLSFTLVKRGGNLYATAVRVP